MTLFYPNIHHRRSIRLPGYDYTACGAYFVTICTQGGACLFGEIINDQMQINDAGRMILDVWRELPAFYPGVAIDAFIAMPNHVHGIIVLVGTTPRGCPDLVDHGGYPDLVDHGCQKSGQAQGPDANAGDCSAPGQA